MYVIFRVILKDLFWGKISGLEGFFGKLVVLELFDFLGMVVVYKGVGEGLIVINLDSDRIFGEFIIVKGLNGEEGIIFLRTREGCFVYSDIKYNFGIDVKLSCEFGLSDSRLKEVVSFIWNEGFKEYYFISFVVKGLRRSYVFELLLGIRDEFYNVYFNIIK